MRCALWRKANPGYKDVDRPIHHLVGQHFAQSYVERLLAIPSLKKLQVALKSDRVSTL